MKRILVVEDNRAIGKVMSRHLSQMGFEVDVFADGAEALLHTRTTQVDLILTDVQLPGISGLELLDQLRYERPDTPVIVMTAFTEDDLTDAIRFGARDLLTKPVYREQLHNAVVETIGAAA